MNKLLISHRGNLRGPNPDYENNPEHIVKNVLPNFDCEVDLRFDSHNNTFIWVTILISTKLIFHG
ncbi:hypothetical protein CM15mP35_01390 [bacterium]|nr:MAG: hypothetical protein CM15mP35_01390 [bacterium]